MSMKKRLYKSEQDRKIAGVCGGIAEYLEMDSSLVRVAFVLFCLFVGLGIFVYILMWLIVPIKSKVT